MDFPDNFETDNPALNFWHSPSLAVIMEAWPAGNLPGAIRDFLTRCGREPLTNIYGFPDFRSARRDLGMPIAAVADRWLVSPAVVCAVEYGWKPLPLSSAIWCCERLEIPLGALFHDVNFVMRPRTRIYNDYLRDDQEQISL